MRDPDKPAYGRAMPHGSSLERLRETNRRAITTLLAADGPMSRADLVRGTGLSRTTVSSLVGDPDRGGLAGVLVRRRWVLTGGGGRGLEQRGGERTARDRDECSTDHGSLLAEIKKLVGST